MLRPRLKMMSKAFNWLIDLVYPNRCPFCGEFIAWSESICKTCENRLETADFCPKCGHMKCACNTAELFYDGCAAVYPYSGAVRDGILRLKYSEGFDTARFIVPALAKSLRELGFVGSADIITAVPMSKKRRRETGYNQAEYIAKLLSCELRLPCDFRLIGKSASAQIQHRLSANEREIAAKEAYFAKNRRIDGKTVILCDDIITTGSTLSACAAVLKSMGADRVYCAALAATPLDENTENAD